MIGNGYCIITLTRSYLIEDPIAILYNNLLNYRTAKALYSEL